MTDRFIVVFVAGLSLTMLCGIIMGMLAIYGPNPQPAPIASLFDTLKYIFAVGCLAIITLLSALPRPTNPPKKRDDLPAQ